MVLLTKRKRWRRLWKERGRYESGKMLSTSCTKAQFVVKRDDARASLEQERLKKKDGEEELVSLEKAYASKKAQYDAVKKELDDAQSVGILS
jgi:hypothetical protein